MIKIAKNFILMVLCLLFVNSKVYSDYQHNILFICADEIGPLIEFKMPKFKNASFEEKFETKYFLTSQRKKYVLGKGVIKKKNSPIDYSYFYYNAELEIEDTNPFKLQFDFFPPSHMMIKKGTSAYNSLVCWKNK